MTATQTPPPENATDGGSPGIWARIGQLVTTRPVWVATVSSLLLLAPLLALPSMELTHDTLEELPDDAGAVQGFDLLREHFPASAVSPIVLVIDDETAVTEPASLRALADLSRNLKRMDEVATVRSVAMPTDGERPEVSGEAAEGPEQIDELSGGLRDAADGAGRLADGADRIRSGLATIDERLPALRSGLGDATDGVAQLLDGVARLREGVRQLDAGLVELRGGLVEARDGARRLRTEVAVPAEEAIREAWDAISDFTVGASDPEYERAARATGEAYGYITGEDPLTGQQVEQGYEGLPEALGELAAGLGEAVDGVDQLRQGAGQLDDGLVQLADGLRRLRDGLQEAEPGVAELQDGVDRLLDGSARLSDGASKLRTGLADGAARIEDSGLVQLLEIPTGDSDEPFVITPGILSAMPEVRDQLDLFLAQEDTRTRLFIGLKESPFSPEALESVGRIREIAALSLNGSPLEDATVVPTGATAFFADLDEAADRDFGVLVIAVVIGVFLVLVLLLRALVAPVYMVVTVLLSFGAALGLATIWFQWILGHGGIAWWVPAFLYVLLVALGADYNIYLMSRVREEADHRTTREAVAEATRSTGGVITSAGLILAGTFAALMWADMRSLAQMGFAATVGILLDTFVVRTLLVPAIATLLGRHNWWPSARSKDLADA